MEMINDEAEERSEEKACEVEPDEPHAQTIQEYFANPNLFRPHPDFIKDDYYYEEDTALILAIRNLNYDAVTGLLKAGANPNAPNLKGVTPISAASHKGHVTIIEQLVDAGASVNAVNSTGSTALIQASHFGHLNAVKLLLQHGSIADFQNVKGTTALMRASQEGYVEIVLVLLAAQSDVNRKNNEGMNSLMLASQRGHEKVVLVLVQHGAAMDEQTSQGSTALMLACKRGNERVVEVLVACGAEIYMRDCRARSARDTAVRRRHSSLLQYLDTQFQVQCLQDNVRSERRELLKAMREASIMNKLQYSPETQRILHIMRGVDRAERLPDGTDRLIGPEEFHTVVRDVLGDAAPASSEPYCTSYANYITSSPSSSGSSASSSSLPSHPFRSTWTFPTDVCVANIHSPLSSSFIASAPYRARHPLPAPAVMSPHRPGYAPWQWPVLLHRVFDLPLGVHELVIDFLPAPRIWKTCIIRLKRRVMLAPQAATLDISIMIDEMLSDMCLFSAPVQQGHLVAVSRHEAVPKYLTEQWHIPPSLVQDLVTWSDVQSLIARSADCDVSFKANCARKFLLLAASMYRYLASFSNLRTMFSLSSLRSSRLSSRRNRDLHLADTLPGASSSCDSSSDSSDSNGCGYVSRRGSANKGGCCVGVSVGDDSKAEGHGGDNNPSDRGGPDVMDVDCSADMDDDEQDMDHALEEGGQGAGGKAHGLARTLSSGSSGSCSSVRCHSDAAPSLPDHLHQHLHMQSPYHFPQNRLQQQQQEQQQFFGFHQPHFHQNCDEDHNNDDYIAHSDDDDI